MRFTRSGAVAALCLLAAVAQGQALVCVEEGSLLAEQYAVEALFRDLNPTYDQFAYQGSLPQPYAAAVLSGELDLPTHDTHMGLTDYEPNPTDVEELRRLLRDAYRAIESLRARVAELEECCDSSGGVGR